MNQQPELPTMKPVIGSLSHMTKIIIPLSMVNIIKRFSRSIQVLALIFVCGSVAAADVPNFDKPISMAAREQSVPNFFAELFGHLGVPVKVDPNIAGSVNGDFQGTAREIYRDVEKAFQLTMYFDSSKVYIYSSDQMSRKIIPMSENLGKMVIRNAKQMHAGDSLNKAVWSDMGLVVTGTDRYRNQIESYTQAIRNRTVAPNKVTSAPVPIEIIKVFKLKYAWADDTTVVSGGQELLVRGVATLLRTVVESGMVGVERNVGTQRSRLPRTEKSLRGEGLQSVGRASTDRSQSSNESSDNATVSSRSGSANQTSETMGNTRIVADPLNNAVIIRDRSDRMQNYQDLIDALDVEPKMVEIEATIIDMDTDRLRSLGIDWRVQGDGADLLFGSAAATNNLLTNNPSAISDGLTGFTQNVLNSKTQFLSRIRALEQQNAARIVSKPHVMTLANVEALLDTTSTFFIRVAGREEVDLFNVSVGTTMRVTPHVFEQGGRSQIKLKIDIVDGNQALQKVDGIPVIDESTINTQAIINAGQSLLIGGLVREFKSTGVTKVPLLGNIPGIGALFRNTSKITSRVERMFLITPRLNNQVVSGKRYSVPILKGTEAQILESGPSRLEPTLAGLASRDTAFPLQQPLPKGNANVGLTVPNQPLPDSSDYPEPDFGNSAEKQGLGKVEMASVRGRMLNQNTEVHVEPIPQTRPSKPQTLPLPMLVAEPPVKPQKHQAIEQNAPSRQPRVEPVWQSVQRVGPEFPSSLGGVTEVAVENEQGFIGIAKKRQATPKPLLRKDSDDGWEALPPTLMRKASSTPVMPRQIMSSNDLDWAEIK